MSTEELVEINNRESQRRYILDLVQNIWNLEPELSFPEMLDSYFGEMIYLNNEEIIKIAEKFLK